MSTIKSLAYILTVQEYRETSRLVRVFTDSHGRVSLVAKGVTGKRSRNAHAYEPFQLLHINWNVKGDSTLGNLYSAEVEETYPIIRQDLSGYAQASAWLELIGVIIPELEAAEDAFNLTREFFGALESRQYMPLITHLPAFFSLAGFGLAVPVCSSCDTNAQLRDFYPSSSQWTCTKCSPQTLIDVIREPQAAIALQKLRRGAVEQLDNAELQSLLRLYRGYLFHHIDRPLKTWSFLEQTLLVK